jgi:hypothetical protein
VEHIVEHTDMGTNFATDEILTLKNRQSTAKGTWHLFRSGSLCFEATRDLRDSESTPGYVDRQVITSSEDLVCFVKNLLFYGWSIDHVPEQEKNFWTQRLSNS